MSNDAKLQHAVLSALEFEPQVDAGHIGVAAEHGVITLTGHVWTYAQKHAAEEAAIAVRGVVGVADEIEVRLPDDDRRSDDEIAAAAAQRLAWDASLPTGAVKVTVENGWMTLSGSVDWRFQKDLAQADVRHLRGVVGVSNHIAVKPQVDPVDVSDRITHALHRSWFFDPKTIQVTVDGAKVHLTGTAVSPHDRRIAAATAWSVAGVKDVENDIVVA